MTKANLIDHVAEATKGTKKETEQVIDAVLASITEALDERREGGSSRLR
jgi:nucleoid DNA-binding protein